jgi:DNA invertase Pin-like site-specific DNA recombinase
MKQWDHKPSLRCAIYTRVSTENNLEQEFNSLDNQWEASEAYIKSQAHEGWKLIRQRYDDGGFSGGSMERPALQKLLDDVRARRIDVVVVYKVDRLTRSLADFAKLVELFDAHGVSFISVTQAFNTTTSMGRLTLNMLLSFAQFEREITGERIRDKASTSTAPPGRTPGATRWASSAASGHHGGGSTTRGSVVISATVSAPSRSATICPSQPIALRSRRILRMRTGSRRRTSNISRMRTTGA